MVYLVFDSNIWIYLLDESWKEENSLDYLEHWIQQQHINILVPRVIIEEWNRNRESNKERRQKVLADFFSMAEEILPSSFYINSNKPDFRNKIIEDQFSRIEDLIGRAEVVSPSSAVMQQVI